MRLFSVFLLTVSCACAQAGDGPPSPQNLLVFDYSGQRLQQHWAQLMSGPRLPYPDQQWLQATFSRYPDILKHTLTLAGEANAHPALRALQAGNSAPLTAAIQDVWRLHYEGQFQQAFRLGMQLGPAGAVPALYSRLMYATLLIQDPAKKLTLFRSAAAESARLLPLAEEDAFARFGQAYAHARILELLDTRAATGSGYLNDTQDTLQSLQELNPQNPLYPAMLGGIQAGVVGRVGSFIGRITYGATARRAEQAFERALSLEPHLPVIYNEYAKALGLMDAAHYHKRRLELLEQCTSLSVYSAEEALNRQACALQLTQLQQDNQHD